MAEYIERDVVLKNAQSVFEFRKEHYMDTKDIESLIRYLEWVPAADVVEAKHGRCRYCSPKDCAGLKWDFEDIEVSVTLQCGVLTICNQYGDEAEMPIKYCPNCGARMDGE